MRDGAYSPNSRALPRTPDTKAGERLCTFDLFCYGVLCQIRTCQQVNLLKQGRKRQLAARTSFVMVEPRKQLYGSRPFKNALYGKKHNTILSSHRLKRLSKFELSNCAGNGLGRNAQLASYREKHTGLLQRVSAF